MDAGPLTFVPYSGIKDIYYKDSIFSGRQLFIKLESNTVPLTALGVLSRNEKREIVDIISSKIQHL